MTSQAERGSLMSVPEFNALLRDTIPTAGFFGIEAESIAEGSAVLRLSYSERLLRPGGTHGGPSMMALADLAMYAAVLSLNAGSTGALTTQLSVNFLARPPATDLLAECRIIVAHELSVVGRISVFPGSDATNIVCTSICTYSIPS